MNRRRYVGILAFLVIGLTANSLLASANPQADRGWLRTAAKREPSHQNTNDTAYGKWAAAALLAGLGGFLIWKRRKMHASATPAAVSKMRILAVTRLSSKAQIVAVEIQGRTLLVGSTDSNVTRLGWLDEPGPALDEDDEDEPAERPTYGRPKPFAQGKPATTQRLDRPLAHAQNGTAKAKATASSVARPTKPMKAKKPSRFRELLADAIGLEPRRTTVNLTADVAPVDELVAATEDRYVGREAPRANTQRIRRDANNSTALIDVEGQAKGLVARLNRSSI